MAIDFPNSPALNEVFQVGDKAWMWDGEKWVLEAQGVSTTSINVSDTAPSPPVEGDLWFESDTAKTYVYYDSAWVEIGGIGSTINEATLTEAGTVYGYQDGPYFPNFYNSISELPGILTLNWTTGVGSYAGDIAALYNVPSSMFASSRPFYISAFHFLNGESAAIYGTITSYSTSSFVFSFDTVTSYTSPSQKTSFNWSNDSGNIFVYLNLSPNGGNTFYGESNRPTSSNVTHYANTSLGASAGATNIESGSFYENVFVGPRTTINLNPSSGSSAYKNVVVGSEAYASNQENETPAVSGSVYGNVFIGGNSIPAFNKFVNTFNYPNINVSNNTFINPQSTLFNQGDGNIDIAGKIIGRNNSGYTHLSYPDQPYLQLRGNGGTVAPPASGAIRNNFPAGFTWSYATQRGGSMGWNPNNGTIVAPQTGVYLCSFSSYVSSPAFGNYTHILWLKNGSTAWNNSSIPYNIFGHHTDAGRLADGAVVSYPIYLNQNDTLGISLTQTGAQFTGDYTYMSFLFLG